MRTLCSFIATTLDGFYAGPDDEFDWPNVDEEFYRFSISHTTNNAVAQHRRVGGLDGRLAAQVGAGRVEARALR